MQTLMNASLTREGVTTIVSTLLVALSAVAILVTPWLGMDTPARVS